MSWSSADRLGQWVIGPALFVNNNVWNKVDPVGPQTLYAYGPDSWYVVADHNQPGARPGAIKSYPDTQRNFTDRTVDSFSEVRADFDMTNPPVGEWNACFDIWVGAWGAIAGEVMVWTDHRYNGVIPPKNAVESDTVTIDGQGYTAWKRPLNTGDSRPYIALAMTPMKAAGSIDLLKVFRWLVDKGWLKGTDKVAAIEYGVEIANTAGGPQTFRLNNYMLTAQ